jgi:hypothetical protein
MNEIVFDLETDGLIDDVTQIWCATFYNVDKDITISFIPINYLTEKDEKYRYSLNHLSFWLDSKKDQYTWICHNSMKYDREVIKKLLGIELPLENIQDTFIWSQLLWPDIQIPKGAKGRHGLDAWGLRFGIPKPKHDDWTQYSEEMLIRNQEDVKINTQLWLKIKEKISV